MNGIVKEWIINFTVVLENCDTRNNLVLFDLELLSNVVLHELIDVFDHFFLAVIVFIRFSIGHLHCFDAYSFVQPFCGVHAKLNRAWKMNTLFIANCVLVKNHGVLHFAVWLKLLVCSDTLLYKIKCKYWLLGAKPAASSSILTFSFFDWWLFLWVRHVISIFAGKVDFHLVRTLLLLCLWDANVDVVACSLVVVSCVHQRTKVFLHQTVLALKTFGLPS